MTMRFFVPHKRSFIIVLCSIAITIGLIYSTLASLRQEAITTHRHIANLHAYSVDEHFATILEQIDHTISRISSFYQESPFSTEDFSIKLTDLVQNAPYLRSLSLLKDEDIVIASSYTPNIGMHFSKEIFLPAPLHDTSILQVGIPHFGRDIYEAKASTPHTPITDNGLHFIPLRKKILIHQQSYTIVASLNPHYFTNRYLNSLPIHQGEVMLWRIDGILLLSTNASMAIGMSHYSYAHPAIVSESYFEHLVKNRHKEMDAFRLARLHPFVTEVSMNEANALSYWDQERSKVFWISAFLISMCGLLGLTLLLRYYREMERQKTQLGYEKQFRIAMEATQTGLWTWNMQTNAITWDSQCYLLLGYEPYAFEPSLEKIYSLTHPEDTSAMFISIKEQVMAHGSFTIERRMMHANHEWVWVQVRGKVIEFTLVGDPLLLTGVYINIDSEKKAEELRLFAVAFETQEAIMITNAKESILKVNEAFTRITGYTEAEVLGKTPRILCSGKHDAPFYEQMWKALHEEGFWQGEVWNKRKNGEIYAQSLTITVIRSASTNDAITTNYLANFNDITLHKIAQKQIHDMAYHDSLTHLPNRSLLLENIQKALLKQHSSHHYAALIFIDLDRFKALNDQYGHDMGDMLLIHVAKRLVESIRHSDTAARLGGDEFVILLENLGSSYDKAYEQTQNVAHKILSYLCEPYELLNITYSVEASLGCTLFSHNANKDAQTLLKEADNAMYEAKSSEDSHIHFWENSPKNM